MAVVRTCLLLHGAGSTPEFMQRAFAPAARAARLRLITPDVRGMDMAAMLALIDSAGPDVVGGVSLGAHAAGMYAARTGFPGPVYAVMPAWIGTPGSVAALTDHTSRRLLASSVADVLAEIKAAAPNDWITEELVRAWTGMRAPDLAAILRIAALQPAPEAADLAAIPGPVVVVALDDDPTHPTDVARTWAAATGAPLRVLPRTAGPQALGSWLADC